MNDEKKKLPIDFSEITEEDIQTASNYKQLKEYTPIDLLQALIDSESSDDNS